LRRLPVGFSEVQLGVGVGAVLVQERIGTGPRHLGWGPKGAVVAGIDLPLARWLAVRLLWSAGVELLPINGALTATPEIRSSLAGVLRL
jgi:hypothetical protein